MLDTDVASYVIKRRPAQLAARFREYEDVLCVSVMTAAELRFGAEKSGRRQLIELVEAFLERLAILDWSDDVCAHYARTRIELERAGKPIGNMDLLIAAHALSRRMTLITNNMKHFAHVPGLRTEVWH